MIIVKSVDLYNQYGWVIGDGLQGYAAGWFTCESDREYFREQLHELFPETMVPGLPALLVLFNNSDPDADSQMCRFSTVYVEKYLDEQEGMDIDRSLKIHRFVDFVLQGSMTEGYDIQKQFEAALCQP